MEIVWLGHSCFRLRAREAAIVTDPCPKSTGYSMGRPTADIVTVSHEHESHNAVEGVAGSPRVVRGPGEYEIAGVLITGIRTYHDNERGARLGTNTAFIIEAETLRLCHLGDLGHLPTPELVEAMGAVDILLVPVGGGDTLGAATAAETVSLLEPKLVIPMHYATPATTMKLEPLDRFLKEMGSSTAPAPQPRLSVSRTSLPHETQIAILDCKR
jgi:L-ascorbate metabolism protein UlaG (beta-lactamase superfamily)